MSERHNSSTAPITPLETDGCESGETIRAYVWGELDDAASLRLEAHLETCQSCENRVTVLERQFHEQWRKVDRSDPGFDDLGRESACSVPRGTGLSTWIPPQSGIAWFPEIGSQVDDFLILGQLGLGGLARVYLAHQRSLQRLVALKISQHRTPEAKLLSQLDHPNIVRVYDERQLVVPNVALLYMQVMPGGSLKDLLERLRDLPVTERSGTSFFAALRTHLAQEAGNLEPNHSQSMLSPRPWSSMVCWLGAQIAEGLRYGHEKGILHRDLKPGNILFSREGRPHLADFNLSFGRTVSTSGAGQLFGGTLPYMSPEQLRVYFGNASPSEVGSATDVYSLGIILLEMFSGRPVFTEALHGTEQVMKGPANDQLGKLLSGRRIPEHDGRLKWIDDSQVRRLCVRMLDMDPEKRPSAAWVARILSVTADPALRSMVNGNNLHRRFGLSRYPVLSLVLSGILPNALLAVTNLLYNEGYTGMDLERLRLHSFFLNPVLFTFGAAAAFPFLVPLRRVIQSDWRDADFHRGGVPPEMLRCFHLPTFATRLVFGLWVFTGLAYPLLQGQYRGLVFAEFLASQVAHGAIAASLTSLMLVFTVSTNVLPRFFWIKPTSELRRRVEALERQAEFHAMAIGVAPSCILMMLAVFLSFHGESRADSMNRHLVQFFLLGAFCATSTLFAAFLMPRIRSAVTLLKRLFSTDADGV